VDDLACQLLLRPCPKSHSVDLGKRPRAARGGACIPAGNLGILAGRFHPSVPQLPSQFFLEEDSVRNARLMLLAALTVAGTSPAFAQRHPGGGPPSAAGNHGSSTGAENGNATSTAAAGNHSTSTGAANGNGTSTAHANANSMNAAPSNALTNNPAIGAKIKALTGKDAATSCSGFKTIGLCVAAAHVAQNLKIPGGIDALRSAMSGGMSLGKAIQSLDSSANAKSESKKANKQAKEDMETSGS